MKKIHKKLKFIQFKIDYMWVLCLKFPGKSINNNDNNNNVNYYYYYYYNNNNNDYIRRLKRSWETISYPPSKLWDMILSANLSTRP